MRPIIGSPINLTFSDLMGSGTNCALLWGLQPADRFVPFIGGNLLVQGPFLSVDTIAVPPGGGAFPCNVSPDCGSIGINFYLQSICLDPCAPSGLAGSAGLRLQLGNL